LFFAFPECYYAKRPYFLVLGGEGGDALAALLDGGLLVVLANAAGVHQRREPATTLGVMEKQGHGALDPIAVVLARLVVVSVVLRLGHGEQN
jgi:hypothetical protein